MFRFHWKSAKLETNGILQCSLSIPSSVKVHIVNEIRKRRLVKRFKVSKLTDGDGIAAKLTFLRKHSQQIVIFKENFVFAFKELRKEKKAKRS